MYRSIFVLWLFTFAVAASVRNSVGQDDPFGSGPVENQVEPDENDGDLGRDNQAAHRYAGILAKAQDALAKGRRPTDIRGFESSKLERRVLKTLDDETTIEVRDAPLVDVCQVISSLHDIPVLVDQRALEEIGLSADTPVSIKLKSVKLRSALRLMLRALDLTYMVSDEVLQITTVEAAEQNLRTEMFKLPKKLAAKKADVIQATQSNVVPDTWQALGGPSTMDIFEDVLIVSATDDVLHQVSRFLNELAGKVN